MIPNLWFTWWNKNISFRKKRTASCFKVHIRIPVTASQLGYIASSFSFKIELSLNFILAILLNSSSRLYILSVTSRNFCFVSYSLLSIVTILASFSTLFISSCCYWLCRETISPCYCSQRFVYSSSDASITSILRFRVSSWFFKATVKLWSLFILISKSSRRRTSSSYLAYRARSLRSASSLLFVSLALSSKASS